MVKLSVPASSFIVPETTAGDTGWPHREAQRGNAAARWGHRGGTGAGGTRNRNKLHRYGSLATRVAMKIRRKLTLLIFPGFHNDIK